MNKGIKLLAAMLAVLLLMGCGPAAPSDTTGTQEEATQPTQTLKPTDNPTTEPTTTEPEVTEPPTTEPTTPPPTLDPVTKLSSIVWRTFPELLSLGNGKIVASRNYYDGKSKIINSLDIVDVYEDKVLHQTLNDSTRELIPQCFADGHFLLADPATKRFYEYDDSLNVVKEFDVPSVEGYFSYDRKSYYYVANDVLYRMDVATGNRGRMLLEEELRLESLINVHPDRNILVARFYLSVYNSNCGTCVIDADTGKLLLVRDDFTFIWLQGDDFYATRTNETAYGNDLYFGSLKGSEVSVITSTDLGGDTVNYGMLAGSDLMVRRKYIEEKHSYTAVFDMDAGAAGCDMGQYGYEIATSIPIYLRQEQLIFGVYAKGYDFAPVVIDPKSLTFEPQVTVTSQEIPPLVDRDVIDAYLAQVKGPDLPDALAQVRQEADALEKTYGVSILLGEQIVGHSGDFAAVVEDSQVIASALSVLSEALSKYPGDFLKQFRNGNREGGIYFCLAGELKGLLQPVGMAKPCGSRYVLTLDITDENLPQTIHHELWHAIEMKLSTETFETVAWGGCNPGGFTYYGKYNSGYESNTKWTYSVAGKDCYFVDSYSRINGREDRARIFEYIMGTDATELMQSSALQKKLQIMVAAIRSGFKTSAWTNVLWEQYLP